MNGDGLAGRIRPDLLVYRGVCRLELEGEESGIRRPSRRDSPAQTRQSREPQKDREKSSAPRALMSARIDQRAPPGRSDAVLCSNYSTRTLLRDRVRKSTCAGARCRRGNRSERLLRRRLRSLCLGQQLLRPPLARSLLRVDLADAQEVLAGALRCSSRSSSSSVHEGGSERETPSRSSSS